MEIGKVMGGGSFPGGEGTQHTVQKGDTLQSIAKQFSVGMDELLQANPHLSQSSELKTGMSVNLPEVDSQPKVSKGDTMVGAETPNLFAADSAMGAKLQLAADVSFEDISFNEKGHAMINNDQLANFLKNSLGSGNHAVDDTKLRGRAAAFAFDPVKVSGDDPGGPIGGYPEGSDVGNPIGKLASADKDPPNKLHVEKESSSIKWAPADKSSFGGEKPVSDDWQLAKSKLELYSQTAGSIIPPQIDGAVPAAGDTGNQTPADKWHEDKLSLEKNLSSIKWAPADKSSIKWAPEDKSSIKWAPADKSSFSERAGPDDWATSVGGRKSDGGVGTEKDPGRSPNTDTQGGFIWFNQPGNTLEGVQAELPTDAGKTTAFSLKLDDLKLDPQGNVVIQNKEFSDALQKLSDGKQGGDNQAIHFTFNFKP